MLSEGPTMLSEDPTMLSEGHTMLSSRPYHASMLSESQVARCTIASDRSTMHSEAATMVYPALRSPRMLIALRGSF